MLKAKPNPTALTFNSGQLVVLVENRGTVTANKTEPIPFGNRTIGYGRHYAAKSAGFNLSALIAVPLLYADCFAEDQLIECRFYRTGERKMFKLGQIQIKEDSAPPAALLSLSEVHVKYDDKRKR